LRSVFNTSTIITWLKKNKVTNSINCEHEKKIKIDTILALKEKEKIKI